MPDDGSQSIEERKRGRPTWYNPELNDLAYKLALLGQTDEEIAITLGIDITTIGRWKAKHRLFRLAIARGRDPADAEVAASLYQRAKGFTYTATKVVPGRKDGEGPQLVEYPEYVAPETAAASLWLRNRQPRHWRDKTDVAVTGSISLEAWVFDGVADRARVIDTTAKPVDVAPPEDDGGDN